MFESNNGQTTVKLVRGTKPAAYYNNAPAYEASEQWRRLTPEIRTGLGNPQRQVIVVFAEHGIGAVAHELGHALDELPPNTPSWLDPWPAG